MASISYYVFIVNAILFSINLLVFGFSHSYVLPSKATGFPVTVANGLCASAVNVHGYKCQEYQVITDDGYILGIQRIPEGLAGGSGGINRQPVVLQHGLMVDGFTWFMNSPQESLALILADNGYDVWISNIRGTKYSRRHATIDPSNPAFWEWSWDELAIHDLPSVIDYVFSQTGQKVHYVGHSMGTLIALAALSQGLLIDKVKSAALLSPIAYLTHLPTSIRGGRTIPGITSTEYNPGSSAENNYIKLVCANPVLNCFDYMSAFTGKNCCLNPSTIQIYLDNEPQSTSTRNLDHFSQMATSILDGVLSKYDYGAPGNMLHYRQVMPPTYNLTQIPTNFPLLLSYGGQDLLSNVQDVNILLNTLNSHEKDKLQVQFIQEYAHLDFIIAANAKEIVYNQIIQFFRSHN